MNLRTAALLAWAVWALCVALDALALLLDSYSSPSPDRGVPNLDKFLAVPVLMYATVGALIVSRRSTNFVGWMLYAIGLVLGIQSFATAYADYALLVRPSSVLPGAVYTACFSQSWVALPAVLVPATLLVLLFPEGRLADRSFLFVPWVIVGGGAMWALWLATAPEHFDRYPSISNPFWIGGTLGDYLGRFGRLGVAILIVSFVVALFSVFVRLASAGRVERQQIKWFAFAAAVLLVCLLLSGLIAWGLPSWAIFLIGVACFSVIPAAVGIAIFKHRLYDIDVVINRTLVYGTLTGTLALVYFGGVTLTQALLRTLTDQQELPQLVIVASTLVIAALFNPLRRRIQGFIDRSFYRSKYDARKTLEGFSTKLRDETDLEALSDDLVGVVRETMQPAHVSLWLRRESASKGQQTT